MGSGHVRRVLGSGHGEQGGLGGQMDGGQMERTGADWVG